MPAIAPTPSPAYPPLADLELTIVPWPVPFTCLLSSASQLASTQPEPARQVLFVDDEPHARKWFARLFADEFAILTASGVSEALQLLAAHGPRIAVLVTDYCMPVRDGLSLLGAMQHAHPQVVRLLATAYAEKDLAIAAINHGRVFRILEKPFELQDVRQALREALQLHGQHAQTHAQAESGSTAMRETLGFLAHELNTPLATALGYLQALGERLRVPANDMPAGGVPLASQPGADTLSLVVAAERRTRYAMSLLSTFVQSARQARPGMAPAPLRASSLVQALLNDYPFEGDERSWVSVDLTADFMLPGPRELLYLALCTLTQNALFALHGHPRPSLHITLEHVPAQAGEAARAGLRLTDNGPGIAPDLLARLTHEPVAPRTTHSSSGMGLLFCRRVVQSVDALIHISSEINCGTSVTLLFKSDINPNKAPTP